MVEIQLVLEDYLSQKSLWPQSGRQILAQYTDSLIVLYQAYSAEIAIPAVLYQDFITENPAFQLRRMTWVKPNFLWMMFRSDWASKKNQEKVLAFHVRREWIEACILEAGLSGLDKNCKNKKVVVQWDPDHTPAGGKHPARKAIQIGLRGDRAEEWAKGINGPGIVKITDITEIVHRENSIRKHSENFLMPAERVYPFEAPNIQLVNSDI